MPNHTFNQSIQSRLQQIKQLWSESEPIDSEFSVFDQRALEDEDEFMRRFGIDCPRAGREAVLRFKYHHNYTDREIKRQYRTGNLKVVGNRVWSLASKTKYYVGWIQGLWITLIYLLPLWINWSRMTSDPLLALKGLGVIAAAGLFNWATYLVFIEPWRLKNRSAY